MTSEPLSFFDFSCWLRFFLLLFLLWLINISSPFSFLLRNWIGWWRWRKYSLFRLLLLWLFFLLDNWRSEHFLFLRWNLFFLFGNLLWANSPFATCLWLLFSLTFLVIYTFKLLEYIIWPSNTNRSRWLLYRLLLNDWSWSSKNPFSILGLLGLNVFLLLFC